jgi:DNA-directed RNA polymerase subunit RPC12/RpoP
LTSTCKGCGCDFKLTKRGTPGECSHCRKERNRLLLKNDPPEVKAKRAAYQRAWQAQRKAASPLGVIALEREPS